MERVDPAALEELMAFLPCPTPEAWIMEALKQQEILLLNHCYLEQCAARTALGLIFRCPDKPDVLLKSEARHYKDYLTLAGKYANESIEDRIAFFGEIERNAIESPDALFRFHSGVPA